MVGKCVTYLLRETVGAEDGDLLLATILFSDIIADFVALFSLLLKRVSADLRGTSSAAELSTDRAGKCADSPYVCRAIRCFELSLRRSFMSSPPRPPYSRIILAFGTFVSN